MRRKVIRLVSLLMVLLCSVCGCGKTPEPVPDAALPEPTEQAPEPDPLPEPTIEPGEATLYRDTWGVPHVYADTMPHACYALGYAQAEDRLDDIYKNVRTATGRMAEAFGPEHAEMDYVLRLVKNAEVCRDYWLSAPEEIRSACDAFMLGVEAYVAEHPDRKPDFALDLHGWQSAAIGRTMILQWPLGTLMDDLNNKDKASPVGSNAFCIAPERSAQGCAVHMTDPHLTWEGMAVFYEARVHAGDVHHCGFYLVGTPMPALGHNAHVAWACTTGGPDTSDVYMLKLNPRNLMQYDYFGEWKTFRAEVVIIKVKGEPDLIRPALYSEYGPLLDVPDEKKGVAYTGATPYLNETGVFEQMYRMADARNCEEFYQALGMNQMMEQNLLFADRDGNIQYVRTGRAPIRPKGFNWSAPVPGGLEATRWLGIHPIEDLVQIKNPPQGYFQNCNVSPAVMMRDSPMTEQVYTEHPYLYNVSWDASSPRGIRLVELLDADDSVTKDEAMEYTLNVYDVLAKPWQDALQAAADAAADRMADPELAEAVRMILEWDGEFTRECAACPLVKFWRLKCEKAIDVAAVIEGRPLSDEDQAKMLDALKQVLADVKQTYGTLDVTWGDINLIGRGGRHFPCPGADFGRGPDKIDLTETVMDVSVREEEEGSGKYVAYNGSSSIMLSFLHEDGIESYSCINWGQSGDTASPHYMDQGERLYANRNFKPTWFRKEDLLQNIESETIIPIP